MSIDNPELRLAADFVRYTGEHIFLTGKAGTGKTTFLRNLRGQTDKRMIITAPTGVAAMNSGGVTLHSFFQLPFGPFVPGSEIYDRNRQRQFRFSQEKKQIIASLDLLVIDEISMVRADLLDAVDSVLRRYRGNDQPFGGVQLLMIGDLHQLSPVAKPGDWKHLRNHYDSVYFFSSRVIAQISLVTIELRHIYRQSDEKFINLLNKVRGDNLDSDDLKLLEERRMDDFVPDENDGYIVLTTHNNSANDLNNERLKDLGAKKRSFQAVIKGEFPEQVYPTSSTLVLKEGAQVMFVRNDPSADKLYFNGKIGKIKRITGKSIFVRCPEDGADIEVEPIKWENIKYIINDEVKEIEEEVVGTFEQYPLKLAWAITIHKSQGLTFEKAVIDAEEAFSHGQVYVALSRCKTLEGVVLSSPVRSGGLGADDAVLGFDENCQANQPTLAVLHRAKRDYQQKLLLQCFDFTILHKRLGYLFYLLKRSSDLVQLSGAGELDKAEERFTKDIFQVGVNFSRQLQSFFGDSRTLPEDDPLIQERSRKASAWFADKFAEVLGSTVERLDFECDNKELSKKLNNVLNNVRKEIYVKKAGVLSCREGFSTAVYLRDVSAAAIDFKPSKLQKQKVVPSFSMDDIEHPQLFEKLRQWRSDKAEERDVYAYMVMHQRVLLEIAGRLPADLAALKTVPGVGEKTVLNYGEEILEVVRKYQEKSEKDD